mmetsp:Transcript_7998/g.26551  ORF Transcript_7998/g.26551 Transcript_7998/m.26551 type:complete len:254 (+) Transcript_7998:456-1217(+)
MLVGEETHPLCWPDVLLKYGGGGGERNSFGTGSYGRLPSSHDARGSNSECGRPRTPRPNARCSAWNTVVSSFSCPELGTRSFDEPVPPPPNANPPDSDVAASGNATVIVSIRNGSRNNIDTNPPWTPQKSHRQILSEQLMQFVGAPRPGFVRHAPTAWRATRCSGSTTGVSLLVSAVPVALSPVLLVSPKSPTISPGWDIIRFAPVAPAPAPDTPPVFARFDFLPKPGSSSDSSPVRTVAESLFSFFFEEDCR